MADASEQTPPGLFVSLKHLFHGVPASQVRMGDDTRNGGAVCSASRAVGGDLGHELRLADGLQVLRSVVPIAGAALHEHGLFDVVSGIGVGPKVVQQVAAEFGPMPQVVVGIDDAPIGVDDRLGDLIQPLLGAWDCNAHGDLRRVCLISELH